MFRSTIRPYERRFARRVGLYDFRVDYDLGGNVFESASEFETEEDLLGFNFVTRVIPDRMYLRLKTDMDVSAQSKQTSKGVRLTEFELRLALHHGLINLRMFMQLTDQEINDVLDEHGRFL